MFPMGLKFKQQTTGDGGEVSGSGRRLQSRSKILDLNDLND